MLTLVGKTCLRVEFAHFSGLKILKIKNQLCIVLNNNSYCALPVGFTVEFFDDYFEIICNTTNIADLQFLQRVKQKLERVMSTGSLLFKRSLFLKGLGYRMIVDKDARLLTLKLGKSHLFNITWPDFIVNIRVAKNLLFVEAKDCARLGDFMHRIYNLYPVDAYKGKGFSYPYVTVRLKEVKKK